MPLTELRCSECAHALGTEPVSAIVHHMYGVVGYVHDRLCRSGFIVRNDAHRGSFRVQAVEQ